MNEPTARPPAPPPRVLNDTDYLRQIADHLKSIRSMLNFFTIMIVLALVLQACTVLGALLGY